MRTLDTLILGASSKIIKVSNDFLAFSQCTFTNRVAESTFLLYCSHVKQKLNYYSNDAQL